MTMLADRPPTAEPPNTSNRSHLRGRSVLRPDREALVDVAAVSLLTALGLWGFRSSFGGVSFLIVGVLGLTLGAGLAYVGARLKQPAPVVALVALLVVVALSGAIALRPTALAGILPTRETVAGLGQGFTHGWKELVTTPPPVGNLGYLLAIPYLCGFLSGLLGVTGALRSRRLWWGLTPPVLVLAAGILTGVVEPVSLLLQGACFAGVTVGWASMRGSRGEEVPVATTRRRGGRIALGASLLAIAALVGLVLGPQAWGANAYPRFLLRSYVEPDVVLSVFPSPLTEARRYLKTHEKDVLFTVQGLPPDTPIRLAVMDHWDGTAFGVAGTDTSDSSGSFRRVGDTVPTTLQGTPAHVSIEIAKGYNDVWAPTVGGVTGVQTSGSRASTMRSDFRYNLATDSALVTSGLTSGDVLQYDVVVPAVPANADSLKVAQVNQPANAAPPDALAQIAADLVGDASGPYTRVTRIGDGLAKGFYTARTSADEQPPGHGYARLKNFLATKVPIGDEEQYGATAALMARAVGVPVRLVMGFRPGVADGKATSGGVSVLGRDLSVWLEVDLDGAGWVPVYTVTPPRSQLPSQQPQPRPAPRPEVQVPPPPPARLDNPANVSDAKASDTGDKASPDGSGLPGWLEPVLLGIGLPLLLLFAGVAAILGHKARRAARRRGHPDPSRAVTGGWAEILDWARDHGHQPSVLHTRREAATLLTAAVPATADQVPHLAARADAAAFGPQLPHPDEVAAYWQDVASANAALSAGLSPWRRWRARLSLRSLLHGRAAAFGRRQRRQAGPPA